MTTRRSARLTARAETKPAGSESTSMPPPSTPVSRSRKRKAISPPAGSGESLPAAPSTPKRRAQKSAAPAPTTPPLVPQHTPSAVRLIAEPAVGTNAPLLSPETSRVAAVKPSLEAVTPSRLRGPTTATILADACAHLVATEPRLKALVDAHHCRIFSPEGLAEKIDPFESLASGIISQQVSGAAAKAIKARFVDLFDQEAAAAEATTATASRKFPTPSQVAAASIERLRGAGLSQRKAEYIQGLAEKFSSGELTAGLLADAPYDEVLEKLIAVRGLGQWSVEMFACFGLKRMDVFSTGDLGVQRGMAAFAGRDVSKLKAKGGGNKWKYMSEQEMLDMAAPFSPYRSVFMWYMWRVEETDISTLE
ncbi:hypothetical protein M406DRAFT_99314 [Cryphonectria parasitica EP155]|uniref:HhH-GPD domain-containing protein n=1 Tax=Cryphonectria parasitica (strain ATCC 38755 / EP155) TaxID=660469 RepID=A0A9P4XTU9_CRYP1|nr:uncharacterized protein M406DRAFT_99314 [Cryphonectria parasitica EP155]KAF3760662.1 hypothetical protein M406DRAFT_99314 [Cryphonectria parasitica EP155]